MPLLSLSTRDGRKNIQLHCYGSITGCASRSESSSGYVFWRRPTTVCMAQHRCTCLTACSRHQRSSLVAVSALLTPRHYSAVDSSGYPWRPSGYPWRPRLFGGCRAGVEQSATTDLGLLLTSDILQGDQVSPSSLVIYG